MSQVKQHDTSIPQPGWPHT